MKRMKITYYYKSSSLSSIGVLKKISSTVASFQNMGIDAIERQIPANSIFDDIKVSFEFFNNDSDVIIIRSCGSLLLWTPFLFLARIRGSKIVVDVPTPKFAAAQEIWNSHHTRNFISRLVSVFLLYIYYPISWVSSNLIIQHSYDSAWFYAPFKNKTIITGNPCPNLNNILAKPYEEKQFPNNSINFIAVSHMKFSHGYDRLIRSVKNYNDITSKKNLKIKLHFVGDGPERKNLETLAKSLGLNDQILFYGIKDSNFLDRFYQQMHIGVDALGRYRKKMKYGSAIKVREYIRAGLPVVLGAIDVDIPINHPFVYHVDNSDTLVPLNDIVKWYMNNAFHLPHKQNANREFFATNLSAETKAKEILKAIGKA